MTSIKRWLQGLPLWLKRLTLFVYYPCMALLAAMLLTGTIFRYEYVAMVVFALAFVVAAIHTGRTFWELGKTTEPDKSKSS